MPAGLIIKVRYTQIHIGIKEKRSKKESSNNSSIFIDKSIKQN